MPTYDYRCLKCEQTVCEIRSTAHRDDESRCGACGGLSSRVFSQAPQAAIEGETWGDRVQQLCKTTGAGTKGEIAMDEPATRNQLERRIKKLGTGPVPLAGMLAARGPGATIYRGRGHR